MLRLKITNLILEESRKGFGTIIAKGILFLLPLYLYFPRNFTESNFKPFNDDSFNLDLALEFRRGEYSSFYAMCYAGDLCFTRRDFA